MQHGAITDGVSGIPDVQSAGLKHLTTMFTPILVDGWLSARVDDSIDGRWKEDARLRRTSKKGSPEQRFI